MWPFQLPPYKVQQEALERARGRACYGFFMEPGTGKTAVVLAEFWSRVRDARLSGLIVVCPNSVKHNWLEEAEKMGLPQIIPGLSMAAWPKNVECAPWLQTINYEAVWQGRGATWLELMLAYGGVGLVLDESINIKNPKAHRTKALLAWSHYASYRRALSGAPMVQGPHDLWSQLRFLGAWSGSYYTFRNRFCRMGGYLGKQVIGAQNETELHRLLEGISFRARKQDWLDLPQKIYTARDVELTADQRRHLREMERDFVTLIQDEAVAVQQVITAMLKMQQIASGFIIAPGESPEDSRRILEIVPPAKNPKLAVLREIIEETPGKVLVFTMFRYSTAMLALALGFASTTMACEIIQGGMPDGEIQAAVDRFNQDPWRRILICQIQSAKYGLTLLGGEGSDRCATTVFYENSYSLDARLQAEDRNHRIGQNQPVLYVDLRASKLDDHVVEALQKKKDVARAVIDGLKREARDD